MRQKCIIIPIEEGQTHVWMEQISKFMEKFRFGFATQGEIAVRWRDVWTILNVYKPALTADERTYLNEVYGILDEKVNQPSQLMGRVSQVS